MRAEQLIGKWAIRIKGVAYDNGQIDRSFTSDPVFILKVTENHIVTFDELTSDRERPWILNSLWNDNNWINYKKLIALPWYIKLLKKIAFKFI